MKRLSAAHPLAIAWEVLCRNHPFDSLNAWLDIKIDTAITMVLDETISARRRAKAAQILSNNNNSVCRETCQYLLETSASSLVRQAVISNNIPQQLLQRRIERDASYIVRRKSLAVLPADFPLEQLRIAANDPHWRVRMALIERIESLNQVDAALKWKATDRETGFSDFLLWRQTKDGLPTLNEKSNPFGWDDDPAVLLAELKQQPREIWQPQLPFLVHHDSIIVNQWAVQRLLEFGTVELCDQAAELATDPRHSGWQAVERLVNRLDPKRRPAWQPLQPMINAWSAEHPVHRTCKDPQQETSWLVLTKYLTQHKIPVEQILPPPLAPQSVLKYSKIKLSTRLPDTKRIAVSGHYLLPTEQFAVAFDHGIDHFFWEHNYGTLNQFVNRLSTPDRNRLRMICGTFEAEPRKITKDIDNALRVLKVDRLDTFLLFWSRSIRRFHPDVISVLETSVTAGKIRQFGLSTHQWQLAQAHVDLGWTPIMVRHNWAHRSAEQLVFPQAAKKGTRIFSFNTTCYGRLIQAGIQARDCIRYSLHQPEIDLVLTAPATKQQLEENLSALNAPPLTAAEIAKWRETGDEIYRTNKAFYNGLQSRN